MPTSFIHSWMVRTVGRNEVHSNDLLGQLSVAAPSHDIDTVQEWLTKHEHFAVDDVGNVTLTDAGLEELERLKEIK